MLQLEKNLSNVARTPAAFARMGRITILIGKTTQKSMITKAN
jgi:hypothetical protein